MNQVKQGDRRPAATATLSRGTALVDLQTAIGVTFKARERSSNTMAIEGAATLVDAENGDIEYRYAAGDTDVPGTYYCEWEVTWGDGTTETFPTMGFDVLVIFGDIDGGVT